MDTNSAFAYMGVKYRTEGGREREREKALPIKPDAQRKISWLVGVICRILIIAHLGDFFHFGVGA